MKLKIFAVLLALLIAAPSFAQSRQSWSRIARGTSLPASVWPSGYLYFRTSDSTLFVASGATWVQYPSADFISIYAEGMRSNTADSASDTTAFYMPAKLFSTGDTVAFSFSSTERFVSLDSIIVVGGTTSSAGDSAAFTVQIRQVAVDSLYSEPFNAAVTDTIDLGAGNVQKQWRLSSFGTLVKSKRSLFTGKLWRSASANDAAADVYIFVIWIFGVGLL